MNEKITESEMVQPSGGDEFSQVLIHIVPVMESLREPLRQLRHDLRTPLNHIIGLSDLWVGETEGSVSQKELHDDLRQIIAAAWKINDMLERLIGADGFVIPGYSGRESPK
ncbi:MAG: hypothetical protein H8F28_14575 [Fibrella sp.]|nr:hypothetical protein [Armatimonadota bacterium]